MTETLFLDELNLLLERARFSNNESAVKRGEHWGVFISAWNHPSQGTFNALLTIHPIGDNTESPGGFAVSVRSEDGRTQQAATTNKRGMAWFRGLAAGVYHVHLMVIPQITIQVPPLREYQDSAAKTEEPPPHPARNVFSEDAITAVPMQTGRSRADVGSAGAEREASDNITTLGHVARYKELLHYEPVRALWPVVAVIAIATVLVMVGLPVLRTRSVTQEGPPKLQMLVLRNQQKPPVSIETDGTLTRRDAYCLEVVAQKDGFLYIVQVDSVGKPIWLFPTNDISTTNSFGANPVKKSETVRLPPGTNEWNALDAPPGTQSIFAVMREKPWPELATLLAQASEVRPGPDPNTGTLRGGGGFPSDDPNRLVRILTTNHAVVRLSFRYGN